MTQEEELQVVDLGGHDKIFGKRKQMLQHSCQKKSAAAQEKKAAQSHSPTTIPQQRSPHCV